MRPARLLPWILLATALAQAAPAAGGGLEVGPPEPAPDGRPVLARVVTYNLHHGTDRNNQPSFSRIEAFLRGLQPDLIGLQEVDRNWSARSEFQDQATRLAEALGFYFKFHPTLTRNAEAGYGLAVLSRYPITKDLSGLYSLAKEPRGYLAVETSIAGGPVSFIVTHLGLDRAEREVQLSELSRASRDLAGPLILAGDFNTTPDDAALSGLASELRDALAAAGRDGQGTLLTAAGTAEKRIDFIFVTPEFRIENCVIPSVDYSDHRPIVAHLSFYLLPPEQR